MRKKLSKLIAIVFILATTLGGAISGFAAPGARPDKGDLTIHKHWAETSENIGNEGTGDKLTVTNPAVKGIQFDVYSITPTTDAPPSEKDGWTYSRTGTVLTVSKPGETSKTYNLVKKDADNVEYPDGKTDNKGELKYTELDAGYYYVEENLSASTGYEVQGAGNEGKKISSAAKPFIVAVPMTNSTGDGWNKDVHVYPKNQGLNPEKKPEVPSVNVGDVVPWTITANVPSDFADYTIFTITDELDKRLNFVYDSGDINASVVVTGVDTSSNVLVTLDKVTDYTVTHTDAAGGNPEKFVVSLTPAGIKKLAGTKDISKISISFKTTVNGNITSDDDNIIENKATIDFTNTSNPTGDKTTTPPSEVDTGEIFIDKKGSDEKSNLKGAEFQLALSDTAANNGEFIKVKVSSDDKITDILFPNDPNYNDSDAYPWVVRPHETEATKLGLKEENSVKRFYATTFEGLQTHTGSNASPVWNSYWVAETKAPTDYNLLDGPVKVTFKDKLTNYVLTETIVNKKGFTLPNTGGVGTILLVVCGIILIGLAIMLTMNKKKKAA